MNAPCLLGVLNVTPDSFSDGGNYISPEAAVRQARRLLTEGADILDIGGESTRPGSEPVSVQEELDRVLPVVEAARTQCGARVSIDTRKYEVARAAVDLGAEIINDISAGSDPRMADLLKANEKVKIILMHMQGTPQTMQVHPHYPRGVVAEVCAFLQHRVANFVESGVAADRIWVDPGIGFGKTVEDNLQLLKHLEQFQGIGKRVVLGTSRKSFLSRVLGGADVPIADRFEGTLVTNLWGWEKGATVFRVHEPGPLRRAFQTWRAIHDC